MSCHSLRKGTDTNIVLAGPLILASVLYRPISASDFCRSLAEVCELDLRGFTQRLNQNRWRICTGCNCCRGEHDGEDVGPKGAHVCLQMSTSSGICAM